MGTHRTLLGDTYDSLVNENLLFFHLKITLKITSLNFISLLTHIENTLYADDYSYVKKTPLL